MEQKRIRNFSIIAHIDHGKSTLADRMLEETATVEKRKMREQVLDAMDLERERGITIKLTPVTMRYTHEGADYQLNLIDTPGHIDFSYEVSRSLKAVEGSILLVDATQGVQAQTLTTLDMARELGLVIIPVVTKIDAPTARPEEVSGELAELLNCAPSDVLAVSGKTGAGVAELFNAVIERIPAPQPPAEDTERGAEDAAGLRALVFDYGYSTHRGIVVYVRVFSGEVRENDQLSFAVTGERCKALEVGTFSPEPRKAERLAEGEIGYVVTGIKDAAHAIVGDTLTSATRPASALAGYKEPQPVVWASLYPESQDEFVALKQALEQLKLSDAALSFEEETSLALGRGFRCGFLGMLHLEIVTERIRREYKLAIIVTSPSIVYEVRRRGADWERIYSPAQFPDHGEIEEVREPYAALRIITPNAYLGEVLQLLYTHEAEIGDSETFAGDRIAVTASMPLRELMRGFFDELKSASAGYASFSYTESETRPAEVERLDILVAEEPVAAFSQVVAKHRAYDEAKAIVERLKKLLPRQQFATKIQGRALGRVLASETLPAMRKDVTAPLYGGDVTRKKKLLEKQKKGKQKMRERGRGTVEIPHDVFLKMLKNN